MLGIGATVGLMGVMSLPTWYVFRFGGSDPHPIPWIRVRLSCAMGRALYPHPQWDELGRIWNSLYPRSGLRPELRATFDALLRTMPAFVETLLGYRPRSLGGRPLRVAFPTEERTPDELARLRRRWRTKPGEMRDAAPTLAFAVLGQARYRGAINAREESRLIGNLLTFWALKSTLVLAELCAARAGAARRS